MPSKLLFLTFCLILATCTAQQLPICGQLEVCFAIDNVYNYNPLVYKNLIRSIPYISSSLSAGYVKAQFFASGIVKSRLKARYFEPTDRLSDFVGPTGYSFLRFRRGNTSLVEPLKTCNAHLSKRRRPRVIVIVTDKFVPPSNIGGLLRQYYTFNLVGGLLGLRLNTYDQLESEPRLSKYERGLTYASLRSFLERYLKELTSTECRIRPNVPLPTEKVVPFTSTGDATRKLVDKLLKEPFRKPRLSKTQNLLPFSANDTAAESAVILRDSFELILFKEAQRSIRKNIGIKSAVGITEVSDVRLPASVRNEVIHNSCHSQECSAKVVVASTETLQWKLLNAAISVLKQQDGFRDAFRDSAYDIWKKALNTRLTWWEVNFKYNRADINR